MPVALIGLSSELQTVLKTIQGVAASHQVARLEVFGSAVTGQLRGSSDVDVLVSFKPMEAREHGRHFFGLKANLEAALGRPVDLLELDALTNPYFFKAIGSERTLLYAA